MPPSHITSIKTTGIGNFSATDTTTTTTTSITAGSIITTATKRQDNATSHMAERKHYPIRHISHNHLLLLLPHQ